MKLYLKLIVSLAVTSGIAAGLLAFTYKTTQPEIAKRELEDKAKALENVFFLQRENGTFTLTQKEIKPGVSAMYAQGNDDTPLYYAVTGEAIGYNGGVPLSLMVGFTNPDADAAPLLKGYVSDEKLPEAGQKGAYVVGFSVINSEETPGLGEKIKDVRPPYTWSQAIAGEIPPPSPDNGTDFQRQFRGRIANTMVLKKNGGDLDAITASTITSNGIIGALRNATDKLNDALSANK